MDILQQLEQMARERDLPVDELKRDIEESLGVAYKKFVNAPGDVVVRIDAKKGWSAMLQKEVVAVASDPSVQISLEEAKKVRTDIEVGDFLPFEVDPNRFGRIAAATFKQVLSQKLREAEHRQVNEVFHEKQHQVVTGTISRREGQSVYVQINRIEAELPWKEQVQTEAYRPNDLMKFYVLRVDDEVRRMRVVVSRTHPELLRRLFELEVPEISQGLIEIKSVAREAGQRSKIAVQSKDLRVDAVGACVGPRGARVQAIVDELYGEKIDIVPFDEDSFTYITNALNPAKVNSLKLDADEKHAFCIVPDNQLSLAIGKGGQNVRLAAKLTGWKIDIRSESQASVEGKK